MTEKPSDPNDRRAEPAREQPRAPEPRNEPTRSHWAFLTPLWPTLAPSRQEFVLA